MSGNPVDTVGITNSNVCPESTLDSCNQRKFVPKVVDPNLVGGQICVESNVDSSNRRDFIRKAALVAAGLGVGATLLGKTGLVPESGAARKGTIPNSPISGCCPTGIGVRGSTCSGEGVLGQSSGTGIGVKGCANCGPALFGCAGTGLGLEAHANNFLIGKFKNSGGSCCRTALIQFETGEITPTDWNAGVSGFGNGLGIGDGNFYVENVGKGARMVIDTSGRVGIGTNTPSTTLCVNGVISAKGLESSCCSVGIVGVSNRNVGVFGRSFSGTSTGVIGISCGTGTGVLGSSKAGIALLGSSGSGLGIQGQSGSSLVGKLLNNASSGDRTALVQFETGDTTPVDWNAGVAGSCNVCKVPDGSFYIGQASSPKLIVSTKGSVGIGATAPKTSLQVNGSLSAKVATKTANYKMTSSDFAILASGAITITLPPAKTASGMIVFIKNVSNSTVTVSRAGTKDTIEGKTSSSLTNQFSSLTLLSNGTNEWFILSSAT